jgi:hypothetical protein
LENGYVIPIRLDPDPDEEHCILPASPLVALSRLVFCHLFVYTTERDTILIAVLSTKKMQAQEFHTKERNM